jgi:hypothetical protein
MDQGLTSSQGLYSLSQLGIYRRDVRTNNVLLGTDPETAAGFISDLDLFSISEEAIKAACPNDYDTVIAQMKAGEWLTVCDYYFAATWTNFSYNSYAQGTALFMPGDLLDVLTIIDFEKDAPIKSDFTFQPRLCHDFESLIWVVVFAMMIHHRNNLAATDPERFGAYKKASDPCWAVHTYDALRRCHDDMMVTAFSSQHRVSLWFPDPREAAFFCDAMRLIRNQILDGEPITYEGLCTLLKNHIQLAKEPKASDVVPK